MCIIYLNVYCVKSVLMFTAVAIHVCTNSATFLAKMPLKVIESKMCVLGWGGGGGCFVTAKSVYIERVRKSQN